MNLIIRTVLGDVPPSRLGRTDVHEHLLMASPLLAGDELDDVGRSAAEAAEMRDAGMDALVELTPMGLGRDPGGVAEIARRSGLHIVLATGVHRDAHYGPCHWVRTVPDDVLADAFTRDLLLGCAAADGEPQTSIRAGVIKVGIGYWNISALERRVLTAAAEAHHRTGAAIICHLERGSAAHEAMAVLTGLGVAPDRVALAHLDRNPDPGLHAELASAGVYICYDGPGRTKDWPDSVILSCLLKVASSGYASRLLLGADVARRSRFRLYGGLPGLRYLPERFVPRVTAAGGADLVAAILVNNPARLLAMPAEQTAPGTMANVDSDNQRSQQLTSNPPAPRRFVIL